MRPLIEKSIRHKGVVIFIFFLIFFSKETVGKRRSSTRAKSSRHPRPHGGDPQFPRHSSPARWKCWSRFRSIKVEVFIELKCESKYSQPSIRSGVGVVFFFDVNSIFFTPLINVI